MLGSSKTPTVQEKAPQFLEPSVPRRLTEGVEEQHEDANLSQVHILLS